jgi:transposase
VLTEPKPQQFAMIVEDLYERFVRPGHPLRRLAAVVDFGAVREIVRKHYCPDNGRPAHAPEVMAKLLFLQFLYDLSDREVIERASTDLALKWFLGLPVEADLPEASCLSVFRSRLGAEGAKRLCGRLLRQAKQRGWVGGRLAVLDSTAVEAKVDTYRRLKGGQSPDPEASDGYRAKNKPFHGYKLAIVQDADSRLVVEGMVSTGATHDHGPGHRLICGLEPEQFGWVTADKAYDSQQNRLALAVRGIGAAIVPRSSTRDPVVRVLSGREEFRAMYRQRSVVERKFAEMKRWHGMARARYWGLARVALQCYLVMLVVNAKVLAGGVR